MMNGFFLKKYQKYIILKYKITRYYIFFRNKKLHGGMKGDSLMIESFQNIYLQRYLLNDINNKYESFFYEKIRPIMTKTIKFNRKQFLLEGYDFHCNSSLPYILECEFPEYNIEEYKTAIWNKKFFYQQ